LKVFDWICSLPLSPRIAKQRARLEHTVEPKITDPEKLVQIKQKEEQIKSLQDQVRF
jgi:hypothetical protein